MKNEAGAVVRERLLRNSITIIEDAEKRIRAFADRRRHIYTNLKHAGFDTGAVRLYVRERRMTAGERADRHRALKDINRIMRRV